MSASFPLRSSHHSNRSMKESQSLLPHQQQQPLPFPLCYRLEYAREWGPCVLGLDHVVRGQVYSVSPTVFCGIIVPCVHEPALESLGIGSCGYATAVSGGEQERLSHVIQSDSYIAWMLRTIPSETADGARCSMGVLEHTTAASIIKEAIAAGIDVRALRVSAYSDPERFRQFLFEAFPMIDSISVYPRVVPSTVGGVAPPPASSGGPLARTAAAAVFPPICLGLNSGCASMGSSRSPCLSPPQSPSSSLPSSPTGSPATPVPAVLCAANVVAQSARDCLSRQMLFRQRQLSVPLARSPLSKSVNGLRKRDHMGAAPSIFGSPMFRCRSSSEESERTAALRCVPYAGSEFGDSSCGIVSSSLPPQQPLPNSSSQPVPIEMFDFGTEDDEADMMGFASPKRIRVVPCSPLLPSVVSCEDSIPSCNSTGQSASTGNSSAAVDHLCSPPYASSSLFVSPPPFASSNNASTSVPMLRPFFGMTSPI